MAERLRIYRAAGPILLERGVARTGIRDVARASCLSPGGIYHYFRSKADLALYGLHPEALSRACSALRSLCPGLFRAAEPAKAIRRVVLGLALDRGVLRERARQHLTWLFAEILPAPGDGARAAEERLSRRTAHDGSVTGRG